MTDKLEPFDHSVDGNLKPLRGKVLVYDMEYGETKTAGGLIIGNDDGKERGIHPRWATVYAVGDDVSDVKVGDRVLIAHGRWTRGVKVNRNGEEPVVVRMVENESIMLVQE